MSDTIHFQCQCGALVHAPPSAAGRHGKCWSCGQRVQIPNASTVAAGESALPAAARQTAADGKAVSPAQAGALRDQAPPPHRSSNRTAPPTVPMGATAPVAARGAIARSSQGSVVLGQLCSICQTEIREAEATTSCDECRLPFHVECWEENLGCSAYGCSNVNALRPAPELRVSNPAPVPGRASVPGSTAMLGSTAMPGSAASHVGGSAAGDIPWEYVFLAASCLGTLVGLLCFGIAPLVTGLAAVVYSVQQKDKKTPPILIVGIAMSAIGFFVGLFISSKLYWQ